MESMKVKALTSLLPIENTMMATAIGDTGSNKAILDGRCPGLVFGKTDKQVLHFRSSLLLGIGET
jgi:hypothetical protein